MKIISEKPKKDRWDQLLEKTIHHHDILAKHDDFTFFDSTEEDRVFMTDEKLVVVSDRPIYANQNEDLLKQIYEKEFSPPVQPETVKLIQKPPRKSLENRRSYEGLNRKRNSGSYSSSRNSNAFDD